MGIIDSEVEVKLSSWNVGHYKDLGYEIPMKKATKATRMVEHKEYVYDFSKTIMVKIEDLTKGCHSRIRALCDYCRKTVVTMPYNDYCRQVSFNPKVACKGCAPLKTKETSLMRYNVDNYAKTSQFLDDIRNISVEKYGVDYFSQSPEVVKKKNNTCLERYGYTNPMQSPEVRAKANETLCKNGTQKTSKQQLYLHSLYGGEINYAISYYAVDICFPEEKLVVEYDGGGHDLRVTLGRLTQEEFNRKEIIRNNIIKREGYKQIKIVSSKDLLPSDSTLLKMLSEAKQYFSETAHSWMTFDIDNSRMINAENKDINGIPYSFGELRKIKDSDLPEIENNNNTNLKGA